MSEDHSVLRPNPGDFVFRFKGKTYPILKGIFYCYSKKFANSPELQAQTDYVVDFDVTEESFKAFINACSGKSFTITKETIFDLECLSQFWGVSDLKSRISKMIKNDQTGQLKLESTFYKVQHKLSTEQDEQSIIDNIEMYVDEERFASLPVDVLCRLLYTENFASIERVKKYVFLKKVLQIHGKEAASLFADLAPTNIEKEEIENLLRQRFALQPLPLNLARRYIQTSKHVDSLYQIALKLAEALKLTISQISNQGAELELTKAAEQLDEASKLGYNPANEILSEIYSKGVGVSQNAEIALQYSERQIAEDTLAIAIAEIQDLLDDANDTTFDLEPSFPFVRTASPLEETHCLTPTPPQSPTSPRQHRSRSSNQEKRSEPRHVSIQKPKNIKTTQDSNQEAVDPSSTSKLRRGNKDQAHSSQDRGINIIDDAFVGEHSEEEMNSAEQSTELQTKASLRARQLDSLFGSSPRNGNSPFHDNGMCSDEEHIRKHRRMGSIDDSQNDRLGISKRSRTDVKSYDVFMLPKNKRKKYSADMASDSKPSKPYILSDELRQEHNLTDNDDIPASIAVLEEKAKQNDPNALFVLGVLFDDENNTEHVQRDQRKAIEAYEKAAELGDTRAMFNLATIYDFGHKDQNDHNIERAIYFYQKAADAGEVCAQTNLGVLYETGCGVEKNPEKAAELYTSASQKGDIEATYNLATLYENGNGVPKDLAKCCELLEIAANAGDNDAKVKLAYMLENGLIPNQTADPVRAIQLYQEAAEAGNSDAQFNLATMYETGKGVERDESKVVEWYEKSAENGNKEAQFNLAVIYQTGQFEGVDVNNAKAFEYYKRSAEQGNPQATFNMAVMTLNGDVESENPEKESNVLFLKAAELGAPEAQFYVAQLYEDGDSEDFPRDLEKAIHFYTLAADNGVEGAQYNLAVLYAEGQDGIEIDPDKAIKYFQMAADQGDRDAQYNLEFLKKSQE